jgi:hypothetical protein
MVAGVLWAPPVAAGTIGRAKLDGSGVDQSFLVKRGPSPFAHYRSARHGRR